MISMLTSEALNWCVKNNYSSHLYARKPFKFYCNHRRLKLRASILVLFILYTYNLSGNNNLQLNAVQRPWYWSCIFFINKTYTPHPYTFHSFSSSSSISAVVRCLLCPMQYLKKLLCVIRFNFRLIDGYSHPAAEAQRRVVLIAYLVVQDGPIMGHLFKLTRESHLMDRTWSSSCSLRCLNGLDVHIQ